MYTTCISVGYLTAQDKTEKGFAFLTRSCLLL